MSSDEMYLNRAEVALTDQERSLKQALVVRDIARLATALTLESNEAHHLVAAMRREVSTHATEHLDELHMHLMGALAILGVQATTPEIIETAPCDEAGMPSQERLAETTPGAQETDNLRLDARAAHYLQDIFGEYTSLGLQEEDKPLIVETLISLRGEQRQTPAALAMIATLRTRLAMMLAGANNDAIAAHEGKNSQNIADTFYQLKRHIRRGYATTGDTRSVLEEFLERETAEVAEVISVEAAPLPVVVHEEQMPISTISYAPTAPNKPRTGSTPPRHEAALVRNQPDFDRLKAAVKEALGDNAALLDDDVTIDDLLPVVQVAYEQEFGLADSDEFVQYYQAMLRAEARAYDLFKACAMEPAKISHAARAMPVLIAATLCNEPASEVIATPTIVTPRIMTSSKPLQVQPTVSYEEYSDAEMSEVIEVTQQPTREVVHALLEYAPIVQDLIKAAALPGSVSDKEWFSVCHDYLGELEFKGVLSTEERAALWNRMHVDKYSKHCHMTPHTKSVLAKLNDLAQARGETLAMPNELIEVSLTYFLNGSVRDNDIVQIRDKMRHKFGDEENLTTHGTQRYVAAGISALVG